jgi:DNA primase
MNKQLQALKDWMDSPEFDENLIKFGENMKIEEARRERYIQWIHDHYKDQLDEIIEKFQLGYSPAGRDVFAKEALQSQFNSELLLKTGIVTERNGDLVDNYRERIIFQIHNLSGKIAGFGWRGVHV